MLDVQRTPALLPQPQPPPGATVSYYHQPPVLSAWSTGICGCFQDVPNCCMTCWCPCITFGQISEIIDQGASSCVANATVYALLMHFACGGCYYSYIYRTKLRQQYMLKGNFWGCSDFCVHFWWDHRALCQEYRELKNRGFQVDLGWQENVTRHTAGVTMTPTAHQGMRR